MVIKLKHAHKEQEGSSPSLTKHLEAQRAGVGGPLDISGGLHTDHLLTYWRDPCGNHTDQVNIHEVSGELF